MSFLFVVIIIAILSFIWAIFSLLSLRKSKEAYKKVEKELKKGRVLFQQDKNN